MPQYGNQHRVLEYVGMVAGMKGVAITEHGGMLTAMSPPPVGGADGPGIRSLAHARGRIRSVRLRSGLNTFLGEHALWSREWGRRTDTQSTSPGAFGWLENSM
jgi:hypothetical protein